MSEFLEISFLHIQISKHSHISNLSLYILISNRFYKYFQTQLKKGQSTAKRSDLEREKNYFKKLIERWKKG